MVKGIHTLITMDKIKTVIIDRIILVTIYQIKIKEIVFSIINKHKIMIDKIIQEVLDRIIKEIFFKIIQEPLSKIIAINKETKVNLFLGQIIMQIKTTIINNRADNLAKEIIIN